MFEALQKWNLIDQVQFMSFDTTASNTGRNTGVCLLLQMKWNKEFISLPPRHHIHELVVARVFDVLMPASLGPSIQIFLWFFLCLE